jgi:hypothetical protein
MNQPTPTPVITSVVTPMTGTTVVPQLVGLSKQAAQEEAARANLGLVIEERDDPDHPVPTVLEQNPPAGLTVNVSSQVMLVISKQVPSSTVPDVVGFTLDEVREGLKSRGWMLATDTAWSSEPQGRIVKVDPPVGAELAGGETLTLTLSSGSAEPFPLEVNLNNTIFLESAELPSDHFSPGEKLPVTLRWRGLQPVADSYTVFLHLLGPGGVLIGQDDHEPREGDVSRPTSNWVPGVVVADLHSLDIPPDAAGGVYQVRTGMYLPSNESQRLPVLDAGRTSDQNNSILVMEIRVGP